MERVIEILRDLESIPSPSGHTRSLAEALVKRFSEANITARITKKGAVLVGEHSEPRMAVAAHIDTLGAMVSWIHEDGRLALSRIGGLQLPSFEGEYLTVHTVGGATFPGTLLLDNPAAHVNRDVASVERTEKNMHVRLDVEAASRKDVEALGIAIGDFVSFDPRLEIMESGFVKGRFLDDKAGAAALVDVALELGKKGLASLPVCFFFSVHEEVGHGASAGIPPSCEELLVVDMGVVGDRVAGSEMAVSICAKDSSGPYDYGMRCRLVELAKAREIPYRVDVFPFYNSDGTAARTAGHDCRVGLIGPGVSASHGLERTHVKGILATRNLLMAYLKP